MDPFSANRGLANSVEDIGEANGELSVGDQLVATEASSEVVEFGFLVSGVGDDGHVLGFEGRDLFADAGFAEVDDGDVGVLGDDFIPGEFDAVREADGPHEVGFQDLDAHLVVRW